MRLGIAIHETWSFFHEIYAQLSAHHQTTQFSPRQVKLPFFYERVNRFLYRRDWQAFLANHDVVFFEWASDWLVYASHLPKTCKLVTRLHRYEMYQFANQINWNNVDKLILVSHAKVREFTERFPQYVHRVVMIPEATSLTKFKLRSTPFSGNIGILCHLTPRKRVYETILAFYELLQHQPGYRLHIAGGEHELHGDYYRALRALVRDLGIEAQVIFYGNVKDPENWYEQIDIFISNSYSEGLQLAPMEAMACGCYVLAHRWEGADELLPAENLFFTDRQMVEKILAFSAASPAEQRAEGLKLRQIVLQNFDIDRIKLEIQAVIESVAASG